MFKSKINLDRHGPRPLSSIWLLPDPPFFSFPPTFKDGKVRQRSHGTVPFITLLTVEPNSIMYVQCGTVSVGDILTISGGWREGNNGGGGGGEGDGLEGS